MSKKPSLQPSISGFLSKSASKIPKLNENESQPKAGPSNLDNSVPDSQENEILAVENSSESVEPKRKSAKKLPKTKFSNAKFSKITRTKIAENVHTEEQKQNNATANKNCKFTGFSFTFGLL